MTYIIVAILLFGFLIAVHELGHFLAAKLCGVKVEEYSIGMGPAIFTRRKGDTQYSLRLLPIGGYCAMAGEDEASDDPAALSNQGFWKKLFIYAAGALVNFLVGLLILMALYMPAKYLLGNEIVKLEPSFAIEGEEKLLPGDEIYAIDGKRVFINSDVGVLIQALPRDEEGTLKMTVVRNGEKLDRTLKLQNFTDEDGNSRRIYGFSYGGVIEATPMMGLRYAWNNTMSFTRLVQLSLKMLVTGQADMDSYSGPVGVISTIVQVGEETEESSGIVGAMQNILYFGAMIAVNLALMNLLPIPALDGGKIFFLVVNAAAYALFRRRIPEKYENAIHFAGFILLMGFMAFITFHDIVKLF